MSSLKYSMLLTLFVALFSCSEFDPLLPIPENEEMVQAFPVANAGIDKSTSVGDSVTFDASDSTVDSNGSITSYSWKEGTTELSTDISFSKSDLAVGIHTINLRIVDNLGEVSSADVEITVQALPVANAGSDQSERKGVGIVLNTSASTLDSNGVFTYSWKENTTELSINDSFTIANLSVGTHTITLTITDNLSNTSSDTIVINIKPSLNDTGLVWGGNYPSGNNLDCSGNDFEAQDCSHGRDVQATIKVGGGNAGFDYTKLDSAGVPLDVQNGIWSETGDEGLGTKWSCVLDNHTGYMWEVKTTTDLHNTTDTYNWYNTDINSNSGDVGFNDAGGNVCYGYNNSDSATYCNTQAFVGRVNVAGLCGYNDWRLPSKKTLQSIVDYGVKNPSIDDLYFPNTQTSLYYWTSTAYQRTASDAWVINFGTSSVNDVDGDELYRVRLVRSGL